MPVFMGHEALNSLTQCPQLLVTIHFFAAVPNDAGVGDEYGSVSIPDPYGSVLSVEDEATCSSGCCGAVALAAGLRWSL